ncbi:MAG: type II/IV secretion system protein [bacterium]|nr:type II/IV secretion system protein [bacterium]
MAIIDIYKALLKNKILSQSRLDQAYTLATDQGVSLFQIMLEQDFASEEVLLEFFSEYLDIPFELIDKATVDYRTASLISESFARERFILPLFRLGSRLSVAITNPFDLKTIEELEMMTSLVVSPVLTTRGSIDPLFAYCYSYQETSSGEEEEEGAASMSSLFEMGMKLVEDKGSGSEEEIFDLAQEAPIARLVDGIIKQAITEKASDIHVEPEEHVVKIRFRVDGLLKDVMTPPKKLESAMISRLKILANLDITETRKPQDGRITFSVGEKDVDFRVSTVRTILGEKMVLRILDKSGAFVSLERLGLNQADYKKILSLISATSGIVVVCGPTGSGKTSTLYSGLSKINTPDKNIITIEDPVEYNLEGINQIQVNPKIGVDFVTGLSAIVRQDPDVIMVGEVRNIETASIAIQAALTGHMVFTTLHTRNAAGTVTRLMDMGIAPFLLNSAIIGVIGQRLVRTICSNCKKQVEANSFTGIKEIELVEQITDKMKGSFKLFKGEGCKFCDNTGYKGRIGIFEIMQLSEPIRDLIVQKASSNKIGDVAVSEGMTLMKDDGTDKVLQGITTINEVARVLDV